MKYVVAIIASIMITGTILIGVSQFRPGDSDVNRRVVSKDRPIVSKDKPTTVSHYRGPDVDRFVLTLAEDTGRYHGDVRTYLLEFRARFIVVGMDKGTALLNAEDLTRRALDVASGLGKKDRDVVNAFHAALLGNMYPLEAMGVSL